MTSSAFSEELELMTWAPVTPGGDGARGPPVEPYHLSPVVSGSADRGVSLRPPLPSDDEAPLSFALPALTLCGGSALGA